MPGRAGGGWESDEENENEFHNSTEPEDSSETPLVDALNELPSILQTQ